MATLPAGDMEPPKRKLRLTRDQSPAILSRKIEDLETSLEVDHMILDYLLYHAIDTCLSSREQQRHQNDELVEQVLLQADEFLTLFKRRYGKYNFDPEMRFRQQLLQLVTLFTQRFTRKSTTPSKQSLEALRGRNKARAREWIGTAARVPTSPFETDAFDNELPLPVEDLEKNRARVLESLSIPAENDLYEDAFYGTRAAVSLLDLLPLFMGVSAQCNTIYNTKMKERLMRLAASWMLQACLEQFLVFGASGTDAVDEAFAWGYKKGEPQHQISPGRQQVEGRVAGALEDKAHSRALATPLQATNQHGVNVRQINDMFQDGDSASEVDGWQDVRDATIEELLLLGNGASELTSHLTRAAEAHPHERAESAFLGYFRDLAGLLTPVLVQLERGKLDGMTEQETQEFINGCGLGIMELLA